MLRNTERAGKHNIMWTNSYMLYILQALARERAGTCLFQYLSSFAEEGKVRGTIMHDHIAAFCIGFKILQPSKAHLRRPVAYRIAPAWVRPVRILLRHLLRYMFFPKHH